MAVGAYGKNVCVRRNAFLRWMVTSEFHSEGTYMARGQRDLVREKRWRTRIARWQKSGLTIREFCVRYGLVETSFQHWRRELRERDAASLPKPASSTKSSASRRPTFVPVAVLPNPKPAGASLTMLSAATIEIRCPSGHVVVAPADDVTTLRRLFAALAHPLASDEEMSPCST